MYYAMVFHQDPMTKLHTCRSMKVGGYSSLNLAKGAIEKKGYQGYVRKVGQQIPVWHNVITSSMVG